MSKEILSNAMVFYGVFLITCGIVAVLFIGMKAKTALVSGGTSGTISLAIAYLIAHDYKGAQLAGLIFAFALLVVFSWRATKTLFSVFDLLQSGQGDLKGKGIAFLIIGLMAIVSVMMVAFQFVVIL